MHLTYNLQEQQQQDKAVQELDTYDEINIRIASQRPNQTEMHLFP